MRLWCWLVIRNKYSHVYECVSTIIVGEWKSDVARCKVFVLKLLCYVLLFTSSRSTETWFVFALRVNTGAA